MEWFAFLDAFVTSLLSLAANSVDRHVFIDVSISIHGVIQDRLCNIFVYLFKEIYQLLNTFKLHLEKAPRCLSESDKEEEAVNSFMRSLHQIENELKKYDTEKNRELLKSSQGK